MKVKMEKLKENFYQHKCFTCGDHFTREGKHWAECQECEIERLKNALYIATDQKNKYRDLYTLFGSPECVYFTMSYDPHGNIPLCQNKSKKGSYCTGMCDDYEPKEVMNED